MYAKQPCLRWSSLGLILVRQNEQVVAYQARKKRVPLVRPLSFKRKEKKKQAALGHAVHPDCGQTPLKYTLSWTRMYLQRRHSLCCFPRRENAGLLGVRKPLPRRGTEVDSSFSLFRVDPA